MVSHGVVEVYQNQPEVINGGVMRKRRVKVSENPLIFIEIAADRDPVKAKIAWILNHSRVGTTPESGSKVPKKEILDKGVIFRNGKYYHNK
jgi:hypothetical protein